MNENEYRNLLSRNGPSPALIERTKQSMRKAIRGKPAYTKRLVSRLMAAAACFVIVAASMYGLWQTKAGQGTPGGKQGSLESLPFQAKVVLPNGELNFIEPDELPSESAIGYGKDSNCNNEDLETEAAIAAYLGGKSREDCLPSYIPADLHPVESPPSSWSQQDSLVEYDSRIDGGYDGPASQFVSFRAMFADTDSRRLIDVRFAKNMIPYDYGLEDPMSSHIHGVELTVARLCGPARYDEFNKGENVTQYLALFQYENIGYMIYTEELTQQEFIDVLLSIFEETETALLLNNDIRLVLAAGMYDGSNTDAIMLGALNYREHTLDVISIPRDTAILYNGKRTKINTVYALAEAEEEGTGMEALAAEIYRLIGIYPGSMVCVKAPAFRRSVDAVGGVTFDIPMDITREGIRLPKGERKLTGEEALMLLRYRGYTLSNPAGLDPDDSGRMQMQQAFFKAAAQQLLTPGSFLKIPELTDILMENLTTSMTLNEMTWFLTQMLEIPDENIRFYTLPTVSVIDGGWYEYVKTDEARELLNRTVNPYIGDIPHDQMHIAYGK